MSSSHNLVVYKLSLTSIRFRLCFFGEGSGRRAGENVRFVVCFRFILSVNFPNTWLLFIVRTHCGDLQTYFHVLFWGHLPQSGAVGLELCV